MVVVKNFLYRPDIDGLRAIAVLAVIFYHAGVPGFSGGFVGVDIFFVISGFLITSIILKEVHEGKFSIARFYERRIRRIFPALYPVILATLIGAWYLFHVLPFKQFAESVATTALFCSNILFWLKSGDYFAAPSSQMPLLHTWSLAVEEQFYIVFPLFLVAINNFLKRKYFPWILAMTIISFAVSVYGMQVNKSATFYMAPTRAWELLVGSIVALNAIPSIKNDVLRNTIAVLGIFLIGYSVFFFTEATSFPSTAALLPVLGAGFLLFSGQGSLSGVGKVLSFRPMVFTGLISYSLYLWHWPLLVFSKYYLMRALTPPETIGVIVLTFIVSISSWKFIEQPFRGKTPIFANRHRLFAVSGLIMSVAVVAGVLVFIKQGVPLRFADNPMIFAVENDPLWQRERLTKYVMVGKNDRAIRLGQEQIAPSFLLWGDSHAQSLSPGLSSVASKYGRAGLIIERDGVAALRLSTTKMTSYSESDFNDVLSFISAHRELKLIILAARWAKYKDCDEFELSISRTVNKLISMERKVVLVADVPEMKHDIPHVMFMAYRTHRKLQSLLPASLHELLPIRSDYLTDNNRAIAVFRKLSKNPKVMVVYPDSMLIDNDRYSVFKDDQLFYMDSHHLSSAGSKYVSPVFEPIFQSGQAVRSLF